MFGIERISAGFRRSVRCRSSGSSAARWSGCSSRPHVVGGMTGPAGAGARLGRAGVRARPARADRRRLGPAPRAPVDQVGRRPAGPTTSAACSCRSWRCCSSPGWWPARWPRPSSRPCPGRYATARSWARVDAVMPNGARVLYNGLRDTIANGDFPNVFGDLTPTRARERRRARPGAGRLGGRPDRAAGSVVKITGNAPSCRRQIEGSGFVISAASRDDQRARRRRDRGQPRGRARRRRRTAAGSSGTTPRWTWPSSTSRAWTRRR